ncbi:MAG TPA: cytochrome b/b6 domain-containing protein, partial [Paracoccus sp. (in: a-proteobacteria)]|nr:cytochrome b/b6 domain-containing protein [Paracoccus sp. (in: a-proteobacteria)]
VIDEPRRPKTAGAAEAAAAAQAAIPLHVWVGLAILALVAVRLVLRRRAAPAPVEPGLQGTLAVWVHRLLYLGVVVVAASGIAAFFGGLREAGEMHELLGNVLFALVGLHILAAIYHQLVLKDGLIRRMIPH